MKKLMLCLLAMTLLLCPFAAMADGLTAELLTYGDESTVLFTDEDGDLYLLVISEDGVTATKVSSTQTNTAPAVTEACWRCGESLAIGDHTAGNCGYKYHSACMDQYFKDEFGHELCPICNGCMYSSGSRHGIGSGLCGSTLRTEDPTCEICGLGNAQHQIHGDYTAPVSNCWAHCWIEDEPHAACPICGEPLCNGEEHSAKGCAKKVQSVG